MLLLVGLPVLVVTFGVMLLAASVALVALLLSLTLLSVAAAPVGCVVGCGWNVGGLISVVFSATAVAGERVLVSVGGGGLWVICSV